MTLDIRTLPVGSKKPARDDPRTLMLATFLNAAALPTLPTALSHADACTRGACSQTTSLGDCTLAGVAHMIMCWTQLAGKQATPTEKAITTLYKHLSPADEGLVMLDVLNLWRHAGIAGHKIHAFVKLDRAPWSCTSSTR
jgi:hypothetical protein